MSFLNFASVLSNIADTAVKGALQGASNQAASASDLNLFSSAMSGKGGLVNGLSSGWGNNTGAQTNAGQQPQNGLYDCHRPLDALGGSGTHSGPDISINPLSHGYLCTNNDGDWNCGGQTSRDGDLWGPGAPSNNVDVFDPDRCELISTDQCSTTCVDDQLNEPARPEYGLFGPGTSCHEWKDDTLDQCEETCQGGGAATSPFSGFDAAADNSYDIDWGGGSEAADDSSYDTDWGGGSEAAADSSYDADWGGDYDAAGDSGIDSDWGGDF